MAQASWNNGNEPLQYDSQHSREGDLHHDLFMVMSVYTLT